jgi:hypothetical protein
MGHLFRLMKRLGKFLYDEQLVASVVDNFNGDLFVLQSFKGGAGRAGEMLSRNRPANGFNCQSKTN